MLLQKFDFEVKPEELLSAQRKNKHFAVITSVPCAEGTWHSRYQHCPSGTCSAWSPVPNIPRVEGLNFSVLIFWLKRQHSQYFLSCVSLAELKPFQGSLTVPPAAAWLQIRPKPWLKWPLQLPRYQGLPWSHFVPARQGALCSVFNTFAVG